MGPKGCRRFIPPPQLSCFSPIIPAPTKVMTQCVHLHIGDTCVNVTLGGSHVFKTEDAGDKWCFGCRKRLPHTWFLIGDPPEEMSYYEPNWTCKCSRCNKPLTRFPGK